MSMHIVAVCGQIHSKFGDESAAECNELFKLSALACTKTYLAEKGLMHPSVVDVRVRNGDEPPETISQHSKLRAEARRLERAIVIHQQQHQMHRERLYN